MPPKSPYKWVEQAVVISALRRVFRRYPPYKDCLEAAKKEYFIQSKHGKSLRRVHFQCAHCKKMVVNKQKVVDHVDPVVSLKSGFVDFNTYVKRLFCSIDNLQVLCLNCHKAKSKAESAERKKIKGQK